MILGEEKELVFDLGVISSIEATVFCFLCGLGVFGALYLYRRVQCILSPKIDEIVDVNFYIVVTIFF